MGGDGVWGPKSAAAMRAEERAWGLPETGRPSRENYNRVTHQAPEAQGQFVATAEGCSVWSDLVIPGQTPHWSGDCRNGKATVEGRLEWPVARDGGGFIYSVYVGEMAAGEPHGRGVYDAQVHDPDTDAASRYEGEYREGFRYGRGTFVWANGERYERAWVAGDRHGESVCTSPKGTRLSGQWRDDKFTGTGVEVYDDGDRYEGGFLKGVLHGQGAYFFLDGGYLRGEWRDGDGDVNGFGQRSWRNGDSYEGNYRNNSPNGQGTAVIKGDVFTGIWRNGCYRGANG